MLTIETTPQCGQTPRILFLLEELGQPYELVIHPDSHFMQTLGRPGPILHDGALEIRNGLTAFRHILRTRGARLSSEDPARLIRIEQWIDLAWGPLGMGIVALIEAMRASRGTDAARTPIDAVLRELAAELGNESVIAGEFSAADCALSGLSRIGRLVDLTPHPVVARYAAELAARPAAVRAARAMAGVATPEQVVSFWFGDSVRDEAGLRASLQRWFIAGRALDAEIRERFTATVTAAMNGELADWAETPRGRLALVLVLDQFARHVHRDGPRAFAGTDLATATVLSALELGDLEVLADTAERTFLAMPLLHSEDPALHERHAQVVERIAALATPLYAPMIAGAREQSGKYRGIIARFGRFPHRNAALGRESTVEEREFLRDFAAHAPPKLAREMLAQAADGALQPAP